MSETGKVRVSFDSLKSHYPTYKRLPPELQAFMDGLNKTTPGKNTPCCVQVSHALNLSGQLIPTNSFRRKNSKIGGYNYVLAVDELEQYLAGRYGRGEPIKPDRFGIVSSMAKMKRDLAGRQGILVFRNTSSGHHTELWDKTRILQDGNAISSGGAVMNESNIFGQPRVLFWEAVEERPGSGTVPPWLRGWWKVSDGNTYYYYFSEQHLATYTKYLPANTAIPPIKTPLNEGVVRISSDERRVVIEWNPADGGQTTETFSRSGAGFSTMNGVSSRYAPLFASKI